MELKKVKIKKQSAMGEIKHLGQRNKNEEKSRKAVRVSVK